MFCRRLGLSGARRLTPYRSRPPRRRASPSAPSVTAEEVASATGKRQIVRVKAPV